MLADGTIKKPFDPKEISYATSSNGDLTSSNSEIDNSSRES